MKTICRIIGTVVLLVAIAIFVLFKLNEMGFLSGALGSWTSNVVHHLTGIKDDTMVFLHEEGVISKSPSFTPTPSPLP